MKVDLGIWDKLTRLVAFLLFAAALLAVVMWYQPVIEQNENIRQHIMRLEEKIVVQQRVKAQLEQTIQSVQTDPETVERLAREKLGLARPDETILRFELVKVEGPAQSPQDKR